MSKNKKHSGFVDETGNRFGRLLVIERVASEKPGACWLCKCDCGNSTVVQGGELRRGKTNSCGCLAIELRSIRSATHLLSNTSEYNAWRSMRKRCNDPNNSSYKNYGGRGISVCQEWNDSFESFYKDLGPKPSRDHSLDRIDVNGNYEPGNVRWATTKEQARNRTDNRIVTYNGKSMTLVDAAEVAGIPYKVVVLRLYEGWTEERALSEPLHWRGRVRK